MSDSVCVESITHKDNCVWKSFSKTFGQVCVYVHVCVCWLCVCVFLHVYVCDKTRDIITTFDILTTCDIITTWGCLFLAHTSCSPIRLSLRRYMTFTSSSWAVTHVAETTGMGISPWQQPEKQNHVQAEVKRCQSPKMCQHIQQQHENNMITVRTRE